MRFVVFADLRGDPHAAWAILQRAKRIDEAEVVCLGNAVGDHAAVDVCIERLRKARVHLVRGGLEAAVLGMPVAAEQKLHGKAIAARLQPAQLAYLREATPPRRLVADGKRILLTSETRPDAGLADVVLHPGERPLVRRDGARVDGCPGRACDADQGESPYLLLDTETGEATPKFAPWDRTLLRKRQL